MNTQRYSLVYRLITSLVLTGLLAFGQPPHASAASILYVNWAATGAENGISWADAYTSLQDALAAASSGDQIWVAQGTYKPTPGFDRTISFQLKDAVAIYGGFTGIETQLSERRPESNTTVLSGDIGIAGDRGDNSYHVVVAKNVSNSSILAGFTILGGNANYFDFPNGEGGGLYGSGASPLLMDVIFTDNHARRGGAVSNMDRSNPQGNYLTFSGNSASIGGAVFNGYSSFPTFLNTTFSNNAAQADGGAMYNVGASGPGLTYATFSGNHAGRWGGAIANFNGSIHLAYITFSGNSAGGDGGALYNYEGSNRWTETRLTNVIFRNNSASSTGGAMMNYNTLVWLDNATFSRNSAGADGGAIYNSYSATLADNATFYHNSAGAHGGAMYNSYSVPSLSNNTFSRNSAAGGGGAMYNYHTGGFGIQIANSIFFEDGIEMVNEANGTAPSIYTSVVQGGCPVDARCVSLIWGNPKLGPLQNNGGATDTMALGPGSSAIDKGNSSTCTPLDQRDVPRPQGAGCDAGAYEVRAMTFMSIGAYDGYVRESAEGSEGGGPRNSADPTLRVGDDRLDRRYRGLLSFTTSGLPDGATVVLARAGVLPQGMVGDPFATQGALVADLAAPYFGKGPKLAGSDYQAAAAASPATDAFSLTPSGWYVATLTSPSLAAAMQTGDIQLRLRFTSEQYNGLADYVRFYSGDEEGAAYRPVLWVYYNP